ncbi:MAG TPA: hypothetical protein VMX17_02945 [Candidatus Glassbacteria bacterium]|nr:hypothetical protein [Candidatus Glassbacteria bacterium]
MSNRSKIVLLPIVVSDTEFCWDGMIICPQFSSTGGHPTCDLDIDMLRYNKAGDVPKPKRCLQLKRQSEVKTLPVPIDHEKIREINKCKNITRA